MKNNDGAAFGGTLDSFVRCPGCGHEYSKALYDWQFIFCNECRTYFEKHTGKRIACDVCSKVPKRYWLMDKDTPNWKRRLPANNNGNTPLTWEGPNGHCEERHGPQCQCAKCVEPNATHDGRAIGRTVDGIVGNLNGGE